MYKIIVACLAVAVVAYVIAMATTQTAPRYFAMMLMPSVCCKSLSLAMSSLFVRY